jgi:hypothetical protein
MFNKKVKLTAYTWENDIFVNEKPTFNKPDQADWLRMLKSSNKHHDYQRNYSFDVASAKQCPAINNYINSGIKFKAWTQIRVRVNPDGMVEHLQGTQDPGSGVLVSQHSPDQYQYRYQQSKTAFKLTNPWILKSSENIKYVFTESHYSTNILRENNIIIAPGLIDYKYQFATNVHMIVDVKKEPYEIVIPYGTPLFTLFPLTEREIDFSCEFLTHEKYNQIHTHFPRCPYKRYTQLIKNLNGSKS